jgi:hypothetical protein
MMKTTIFKKEVRKKREGGDNLTAIRGIVIPAEWDDEGNTLATCIASPGEQEYLVEQDAMGKELLRLIRQEIEVTGIVQQRKRGRNTIAVRTYRLTGLGD